MTLATAFRVGLTRWPWILGPIFVTAGLAALIGVAVEGHVTYRVTHVLEVTDGAPAEAIFVCRSRDVLAAAMEKADLEQLIPPEELAGEVTVKEAARGLVHLTVEWSSAEVADELAAAIAEEASRKVEVIATRTRRDARRKRREIERRLLQVRANREARLAELDDLRRKHPEEIDEHGRPLGTARKRLISVRSAHAEAKRDLAAADAELEVLRARLEKTPAFTGPRVASGGGGAGARVRSLDEEIARLRKDLTDEHPRLAALLVERARLDAGFALKAASVPNPLRAEVERKLGEAEARRSRVAAKARRLEEEEKELEPGARESVALTGALRVINEKLRKHEAEIEDTRGELDRVKREALADATSRAALVDLTKSEGRRPLVVALRADAPPGKLAAFGAALGLMFGVLLAALAEAMDPVVRTQEDVARLLELPVLATIAGVTLGAPRSRSRARALGAAVWLAAFLLAAAVLILLVYPGWRRLSAILSRPRQAPHEVEEVLP